MLQCQVRVAAGLFSLFLMAAPVQADELAKIRGKVALDGEPLKQGLIMVFTDKDRFTGAKIKDGSYPVIKLATGTYKVAIHGKDVPEKYQSETSGLTISVNPGENVFDFRLVK